MKGSKFFHMKYVFHIINLIVKDSLKLIDKHIEKTGYACCRKFCSISFNNTSSNNVVIEIFLHNITFMKDSKFFHIKYVCHIINLFVHDGLKLIRKRIEQIRDVIQFILYSSSKSKECGESCIIFLLCKRIFLLDMKTG